MPPSSELINPRELINPPALADFGFGANYGLKVGQRARSEKGPATDAMQCSKGPTSI
jgi:hypothetical protein